jgi:hypothetical protein
MAVTSQGGIEDCMLIARAFERGANHAMTEESVFAVLTPRISTMRSMAKATKDAMAAKASETKDPALLGLASGDASIGDLINECIPCKLRISFKGQMDIASLLDPSNALNEFASRFTDPLQSFFEKAIQELNEMIDMFRNLDKYVDICAFKKFFTEFVCIPDLQRMLALFTAFLMKLSLEINSVFSLIISLFAPLLLPFLTGLVDLLTQFIMAAIKPIECIIENIQRMLSRLDYNVLFQNIDELNVALGPKQGNAERPVDVKLPIMGTVGTAQDPALNYDKRGRDLEFNLAAPGAQARVTKQKQAVTDAQKELNALQEASTKIDGADQGAADENRKQVGAARQKLAQAESARDLSKIGEANKEITEKFLSMKGSLFSMIAMLRRAASEIEAYIRKVVNELTKLVEEFCGTGASTISLLGEKLQIVQLMALIVAIIDAIKNKQECEDEGQEVETFNNQLNLNNSFSFFTDEDGNMHIEEKDDGIKKAIEDVAAAFGVPPGGDPRQKLKSLVKFTGNDALDSSISRAVDALTTPAKVKFKCPLQTSVADAEQVNKWIRELDSESI